jgi:hypothetical protein
MPFSTKTQHKLCQHTFVGRAAIAHLILRFSALFGSSQTPGSATINVVNLLIIDGIGCS